MTRIAIRLADPVVPVASAAPRLRQLVLARPNAAVRIYVSASAMREVWCAVDLARGWVERGGALAGRYGIDPVVGRYVAITDVVPAPDAPSSPGHIDIRARDWIEIYNQLERRPGVRLLGWYHSHPGLHLGMSLTDRVTQRRIFGMDWQVALIVDPSRRRFRFYIGPESKRARWVAIARPEDLAAGR